MASPKKLLSCVFLNDVLCSYRKADVMIMGRCFGCRHYFSFMSQVESEDMAEDSAYLAESERMNRFAMCMFESCLCDGKFGKLLCFGYSSADGRVKVWKCERFHVESLPSDSMMRRGYLDLVKGLSV
jgi:hypothetical protein